MSNLIPGQIVSHYKILEKLGAGGMGVVYKAEDTKLRRTVALKFLPPSFSFDEEAKKRFIHEAQSASAIDHPNICTVHEIGETEDDQLFISMACYEGETLKDKITKGELNANESIKIYLQIAEGLNKAHREGIVHRDIKPANIFITKEGIVKILDFGLAKTFGRTQLTQIGSTVGTCNYMSPEQARGENVDQRTDIWSLGIVMYEMLTGKLPFNADYDQAIIYSILNEDPEWDSFLHKDCLSGLIEIINKCLAKNKEERYQEVSEILGDLLYVSQGYQDAQKVSLKRRLKKHKHKIKLVFPIAAIIFSSVILLYIFQPVKGLIFSSTNTVSSAKHLLILPIKTFNGNASETAFCGGLVETLSSTLTQVEQFQKSLWVVPASEVSQSKITGIGEAQRRYAVNLVVTGSMQNVNKRIKLTLNLVDADNLRQLNSSIIDISDKEMISLQDKAVIALLEMLHIEMQPQLKDLLKVGETTNPKAYEYYVQGMGNLLLFQSSDKVEEAIRLFKLATQIDTLYALAYSRLGEAYLRSYELTKKTNLVDFSLNSAKKAYMLDSTLATTNTTLGMIYNTKGNYEDAIFYFKKALMIQSTSAVAYGGLATAYQSLNNFSMAEATYKQAINLKPDYWSGYNELGKFYYRHGRYNEALEQFKQVIKCTPNNYRGYCNLGAIYYMLGQLSDARQMFETSIEIQPNYYAYSNLGVLYYKGGDFDAAVKMYEKVLIMNNNDYLMWAHLAVAQHFIPGKMKESLENYKKAILMAKGQLQINPNDPIVIADLASFYSDLGDTLQAITLLNKALKIAPENSEVMYRAATINEHFNKREKALFWIEKALKYGYSKIEIEYEPELKQLISDERYKKIKLK